jgi:hypothetical protein
MENAQKCAVSTWEPHDLLHFSAASMGGCTVHPKLCQAARFIADEGLTSLHDGDPLLEHLPWKSRFGIFSREIHHCYSGFGMVAFPILQ